MRPTAAEVLSAFSLLCFGFVGCTGRPASSPDQGDTLAELRLLVDAARPLLSAAEGLCPEAPRPELCATAARETLASLADAEALLSAVEACQGDDARRCAEEAAVVASETAPRLAARLGRLMLLTQPRRDQK